MKESTISVSSSGDSGTRSKSNSANDSTSSSLSSHDSTPSLNHSTEENVRCYNEDTIVRATREGRNVYVRGLGHDAKETELLEYIAHLGRDGIQSVKIIRDNDGISKGFGFIMLSSTQQAHDCIQFLRKEGYHASIAKESISRQLRELEDVKSKNVYFCGIPRDMDEAGLQALVQLKNASVVVESVRVIRKDDDRSKSVGFCRVKDRSDALMVIQSMNGLEVEGGSVLQVRFADSVAQKKLKGGFHSNHKGQVQQQQRQSFKDNRVGRNPSERVD
jgi:RNA recognition motif-containing protein